MGRFTNNNIVFFEYALSGNTTLAGMRALCAIAIYLSSIYAKATIDK